MKARESLAHAIVCLDANTGKECWIRETTYAPKGRSHRENSSASPTCVLHDERIFAFFGDTGVVCVDFDGTILWQNPSIIFDSVYGVGASLVAHEHVLIVTLGTPKDPSVIGLDCATGEMIWRHDLAEPVTDGLSSGCSRTPVIATINDQPVVLVWGFAGLTGLDARTGAERFFIDLGAGGLIDLVATPVIEDRTLICAASRETIAIDLESLVQGGDPILWQTRGFTNVVSPVACSGMLFLVSDQGIAACLALSDGKVHWRKRLGGKFYASLAAIGDLVYCPDDSGKTHVLRASPDFEKVGENTLPESQRASFAIADNAIFIRTTEALYRVANPSQNGATVTQSQ